MSMLDADLPDDLRPSSPPGAAPGTVEDMQLRAAAASAFLKALAHEGRMAILCHLAVGEKSVSDLEQLVGQRQAAVSQQLARLRAEGLVAFRRDGKARLYSISDARAAEVVGLMHRLFCEG